MNKLYTDFLEYIYFAGNPSDSAAEFENPVQFDELFFEKIVFDDLVVEFLDEQIMAGASFPPHAKFKEILKNHLHNS